TVVVGDGPPVADSGGPYFCNANATIQLDGSGSHSTPPGHTITYGWDLDNDGQFNDSTVVKPSFTCGNVNGTMYSVCLRVTATSGLDDTDCTTVTIGQPPCTPTDQCHDAGTRDPITGVCSNPAKATGSACND